jgi:hypothetical protein
MITFSEIHLDEILTFLYANYLTYAIGADPKEAKESQIFYLTPILIILIKEHWFQKTLQTVLYENLLDFSPELFEFIFLLLTLYFKVLLNENKFKKSKRGPSGHS